MHPPAEQEKTIITWTQLPLLIVAMTLVTGMYAVGAPILLFQKLFSKKTIRWG